MARRRRAKRRKALQLSADSPDARTMEAGGQIVDLANPKKETPAVTETKPPDTTPKDGVLAKDDGVPVTTDPTKEPVKEPAPVREDATTTKLAAPASEKTTADSTTKPTAIKTPESDGEKASAKQLESSVDGLRETFGDEIKKHDTKLTPPPSDRPVLQQSASDALIGLPTNVIPPGGSSEEAVKQLQKDGIPRCGALTEKERAHETAFASALEANLPAMVEEFYARSKDDKVGSYIFEVDGAKKLYAAYGAGKAPERSRCRGFGDHDGVNSAAGDLAHFLEVDVRA